MSNDYIEKTNQKIRPPKAQKCHGTRHVNVVMQYIRKLTDQRSLNPMLDKWIKVAHNTNPTLVRLFTKTEALIKKFDKRNAVYADDNIARNCRQVYVGPVK